MFAGLYCDDVDLEGKSTQTVPLLAIGKLDDLLRYDPVDIEKKKKRTQTFFFEEGFAHFIRRYMWCDFSCL